MEIAATPEMAAKIYGRMASNLEVVRQRLGVLLESWPTRCCSATSTPPRRQELDARAVATSRCALTASFSRMCWVQSAMLQFMQTSRNKVARSNNDSL